MHEQIKQPEALRLADLLRTEGLDPGSTVRVDAATELRRLHEENEALRADAERYRWLKDHAFTKQPTIGPIFRMDSKWSLNAAIDAARGKV